MNYQEQLDTAMWQRKRLEKMQSAEWRCEICGDAREKLNIHHPKYIDGRMAWEYSDNELQCLCSTCHKIAHMDARKVIRNGELLGATHKNVWWVLHQIKERSVKIEIPDGHPLADEWTDLRHAITLRVRTMEGEVRRELDAFEAKLSLHNAQVEARRK
jgi:hypothetical protein